jgi:hypothetical protein
MSKKALTEAIDTYSELLRIHQLNIELLNTMEQTLYHIQSFCQKHHIPFHDEKLSTSISKIDSLLEELDCESPRITFIKPADEKKQHFTTDENVPIPLFAI